MTTVRPVNAPHSAMDVPRVAKPRKSRYVLGAVATAALIFTTIAVGSRGGSQPVVERSTIVIDSVRRGTMVREVIAAGMLVPERVRIIAAITAGRVEQLPVSPGAEVSASTVLVELSNPDVQLERLESERNLSATQAELIAQQGLAQTQKLLQEESLAALRTQAADARRQLEVFEALDSSRMIAKVELAAARDKAREMATREDLERQRLRVLISTTQRQIELQTRQVGRLEAISRFQNDRVSSMRVRAGESGVLQELPLELGQWVNPGMLLARVAQPGNLKAVLRVPDTQARDVAVSQTALIDTRNGIIKGRVVRIAPASQSGTVEVEVILEGEPPKGARASQAVDGTIEVERLRDVLYVARPTIAQADAAGELYRLLPDGKTAERVRVQFGPVSARTIQVRSGLNPGDRVIVSDIGAAEGAKVVRIR